MVCVKYCVFTIPLGYTVVQTHGGSIKRASTYPRPDEERGGDLYRSERSERRSDSAYPTQHTRQQKTMNIFLLGGWAARPSAFYFCVIDGALSYSVHSVFRCRCASLSLCFVVAVLRCRCASLSLCFVCLTVFYFAALVYSYPYLFLVCLAFPLGLVLDFIQCMLCFIR